MIFGVISIKAENAYVELSSGNIDVAWGGLALEREDVKYEVTAPYLTNDIVIVTLAQAGNESVAFEWKDAAPGKAKVEYKLHDGVSAVCGAIVYGRIAGTSAGTYAK